jgi:hypothetical protein
MINRDSSIYLYNVSGSYTSTIATGTNANVITITPPEGYIYQCLVTYVEIQSVPGASSGTHKITGYGLCTAGTTENFIAESPYNGICRIQANQLQGTTTEQPSDSKEQYTAMQLWYGSNNDPLVVNYANGADTDQTNNLTYEFLFRVFKEWKP